MGYVIVIDPGHGGDSLGGNTSTYIEKYLNAKVADYMKERLSQYEGVEVYLTRSNPDAENISIKKRVDIAAEYNADFLVSIHFNMSSDHGLYGSEVWVSAFGEYYKQGMEFAGIEMEGLKSLGFFDRGVKTRIGKEGTDYYGIMRYACEYDMPAVIIEHCHMDESRDTAYLVQNGEEAYKTFGYLDADCMARYLHLKSSVLGVDYSGFEYPPVEVPLTKVVNDTTPPEVCRAELVSCDTATGEAVVKITASDKDSIIQYYQYSYDGGATFSKLYPWSDDPESRASSEAESIEIPVMLDEDEESILIVRVLNRYDVAAVSDPITLPVMEHILNRIPEEQIPAKQYYDGEAETVGIVDATDADAYEEQTYTEIIIDNSEDTVRGNNDMDTGNWLIFVIFAVVALAAVSVAGLAVYTANVKKSRKRRRRRYTDEEEAE